MITRSRRWSVQQAIYPPQPLDPRQAEPDQTLKQALLNSQAKNQALLHALPDLIMQISEQGIYLDVTQAKEFRTLFTPDIIGKNIQDVLPPDLAQQRLQLIQQAIQTKQSQTFEYDITIDNSVYHQECRIVASGEAEAVVIVRDITQQKQVQRALQDSEERYALAAQGSNDGLWDWNLQDNTIYFSSRWKCMIGLKDHEIGNHPDEWLKRIHPEDLPSFQNRLQLYLEGGSPHFEHKHRLLHKSDTYRWVFCRGLAIRDETGKAYRIAGSQTDITEQKLIEQQLLHDALYDTLTGLPNRALFKDRLGQVIGRSKRQADALFAVLLLDLDRFKVINDSLGHLIGDQLLVAVATRLKHQFTTANTIARLGGDEFAILLDDLTSLHEATTLATQILQELGHPLNLRGHEVFITASIGIALSSMGYNRPDEVLRDADTAMYRAKALGKNCCQIFDRSMHIRAITLLHLESDLRWAIDRQEFCLYYQPIISLQNGTLQGFEALLRWQHPHCGIVAPDQFISLAEETGLIIPMGIWVLKEACRQMQRWHEQFDGPSSLIMSVNLSGKQILQPNFIETVQEILHETDLPGRSLKLEITESVVLENAELANYRLMQLRALGVRTALDDFGTGFSSLSYLYRLPIDTLKIDRSFVNSVDNDSRKLELVKTIITLADNLGMDVIAEGVETPRQLNQLRSLNCGLAQGYLFSRPVTREIAEAFLFQKIQNPAHPPTWFSTHYNEDNCVHEKSP